MEVSLTAMDRDILSWAKPKEKLLAETQGLEAS